MKDLFLKILPILKRICPATPLSRRHFLNIKIRMKVVRNFSRLGRAIERSRGNRISSHGYGCRRELGQDNHSLSQQLTLLQFKWKHDESCSINYSIEEPSVNGSEWMQGPQALSLEEGEKKWCSVTIRGRWRKGSCGACLCHMPLLLFFCCLKEEEADYIQQGPM